MVDLARDEKGKTRARLLDLVPGRSGSAYKDWLSDRGEAFRARVKVATLHPFRGYKNAIDDQLDTATSVLDAFHVVKLGGQALDEVRSRRIVCLLTIRCVPLFTTQRAAMPTSSALGLRCPRMSWGYGLLGAMPL